jgi:hypothetical protein
VSRGTLGKLLLWVAAQLATEAYDAAKRLVRSPRKEAPTPMTYRDVELRNRAARCAGHESEPRCETIRPPALRK